MQRLVLLAVYGGVSLEVDVLMLRDLRPLQLGGAWWYRWALWVGAEGEGAEMAAMTRRRRRSCESRLWHQPQNATASAAGGCAGQAQTTGMPCRLHSCVLCGCVMCLYISTRCACRARCHALDVQSCSVLLSFRAAVDVLCYAVLCCGDTGGTPAARSSRL